MVFCALTTAQYGSFSIKAQHLFLIFCRMFHLLLQDVQLMHLLVPIFRIAPPPASPEVLINTTAMILELQEHVLMGVILILMETTTA